MRKPPILFIEQYYYPEGWGGAQIPRDITIDWASLGHRVEVLCGSEQYAQAAGEAIADPREKGVTILRIPRFLSRDVHKTKVLRQLWFLMAAIPRLLIRGRPALFVTQTNPPAAVILTAFVATLMRRPFVIIAQDLYPEVMIAHGMVNPFGPFTRVLRRIFAWPYRCARAVVSLGPSMTARLLEKGVARERVFFISNWSTGNDSVVRGDANKLIAEWGLHGKFVLLYSGNLGVAHDCETLLHGVAAARRQAPHLHLLMVGGGSRIAEARALVESLDLRDWVTFRSFVPFELLPQTFGIASLAVVTLLPGFAGLVVPSKLFGNMARAVPTLYIGPRGADVDYYLRESNGGISVANGDISGLVRQLNQVVQDPERLRQMGQAACRYYREHLSREVGLERYRRLLAAVIDDHGGGRSLG